MRSPLAPWLVLLTLTAACDPASTCGQGTERVAGQCVASTSLSCGSGTIASGNTCVSTNPTCGAGTVNQSGACVPANQLSCGTGTTASGAQCVATLQTCGTGTTAQGTNCVAALQACGTGTTAQGTSCIATLQTCGAGTTAQGTSCVALLQSCGAGTMASGSQCVTSGLTCGVGTAAIGNACTVNLGTVCSTDTVGAGGATCVGRVTCATGTVRSGDTCAPQLSTLCGPGTIPMGGRCVLDGSTACGTGTVLSNGQCVAPTAQPSLTAFSASTTLAVAYDHQDYPYMTGYRTYHRIIVTDLSAGNATAWATSEIAPVGAGSALHLKLDDLSLSLNGSITKAIRNASTTGGGCQTGLTPTSLGSTSAAPNSNFFGWNQASFTLVACAAGGSVRLDRLMINTVDTVRMTFNVQFNDGTLWSDKIFTAPYN